MAHFTQLNLQGNSGSKFTPDSGSAQGPSGTNPHNSKPAKKSHDAAKAAAIGGSLIAAGLITVLTLGTNGCSKSNKPAIVAPSAPMAAVPQATPMAMTSSSMAQAVTSKPAKKVSRQHAVATYKNADYGISFHYPRSYQLMKGEDSVETAGLGPLEMNFVQPGGTAVAAVRLPDGMYKGTNLASAFFDVNVNSKVTSEQCSKFAFENAKQTAEGDAEGDIDHASVVEAATMKMGAAEFTEIESFGGDEATHTDAKYYHVFQNGACYEFALGLETSDGEGDAKPVDQDAVFGRLNWMLSTVKITAAGVPAKMAASPVDTSAATPAPEPSASSAMAPAALADEGGKN